MTSINPLNQTKLNPPNIDDFEETEDIETEESEELFYANGSDSDSDSEYGTYDDMSSSTNPLAVLSNLINAKDNLGTAKDNIDTMDTNTGDIKAKSPELKEKLEKEGNAAIALITSNNIKVEKLSTKQEATAEKIKSAQDKIKQESDGTEPSGGGNPFAPPTAKTFDGTGAGTSSAFSLKLSMGNSAPPAANGKEDDNSDSTIITGAPETPAPEDENTPPVAPGDEGTDPASEETDSAVEDAQADIETAAKEYQDINQDIKTTEKSSKSKADNIALITNKAKEENDADAATADEATVETNTIDTVTTTTSTAASVGMAVGATTSIWSKSLGGTILGYSSAVSGASSAVDFGNEAAKGNINTAQDAITGTAGIISTVAGGVDKIVNKEPPPKKE